MSKTVSHVLPEVLHIFDDAPAWDDVCEHAPPPSARAHYALDLGSLPPQDEVGQQALDVKDQLNLKPHDSSSPEKTQGQYYNILFKK